MKKEEITLEELQKAAMPLVELLRKKGNPRMLAFVSTMAAEITEMTLGLPLPLDDKEAEQ